MLNKIKLVFSTVKHLKLIQIKYQLLYRLKKPGFLRDYDKQFDKSKLILLRFEKPLQVYKNWLGGKSFIFLNLRVDFKENIDWNFQRHGKLWNYNLQYGNYLLQENIDITNKMKLISSLYANLNDGSLVLEPYPASLRSISIIRFCGHYGIKDTKVLQSLHAELDFLSQRLEYHLLGNHLLENAFALIMGGAFFSEETWVKKGKKILSDQLEEQILSDGAHFELSPMYHQIILFRLLELIDWYSDWKNKESDFEVFLSQKAEIMMSWIRNMSFDNGDIPHFNDSADGIAYSTKWLLEYAVSLGLRPRDLRLGQSGFRSINRGKYECKVDFGQVGPSYQPGHAHADALSFILYYENSPFFVEQGTSTYQIGDIRSAERSTAAHNTVVVDGKNQSNVWDGFRLAERAGIKILEDNGNKISAEHDGYKKYGITHKRGFEFKDRTIIIFDELKGDDSLTKEFHLHFSYGIELKIANDNIFTNNVVIKFLNASNVRVENYDMADGYNQYKRAKKIVVTFINNLITEIYFN